MQQPPRPSMHLIQSLGISRQAGLASQVCIVTKGWRPQSLPLLSSQDFIRHSHWNSPRFTCMAHPTLPLARCLLVSFSFSVQRGHTHGLAKPTSCETTVHVLSAFLQCSAQPPKTLVPSPPRRLTDGHSSQPTVLKHGVEPGGRGSACALQGASCSSACCNPATISRRLPTLSSNCRVVRYQLPPWPQGGGSQGSTAPWTGLPARLQFIATAALGDLCGVNRSCWFPGTGFPPTQELAMSVHHSIHTSGDQLSP